MVINRLRHPSDGDIIVPNEAVCLAGTTALAIDDPDNLIIESPEVDTIISEAGQMIPHFNNTRIIRAFSGVRPLLKSKKPIVMKYPAAFRLLIMRTECTA